MSVSYFYRYEDGVYAPPVDEFDNVAGPATPYVTLLRFKVLKRTPKGHRIELWPGKSRIVLDGATKKYACPTREEAMKSFLRRKEIQLRILREHIRRIEEAVIKAKAGQIVDF